MKAILYRPEIDFFPVTENRELSEIPVGGKTVQEIYKQLEKVETIEVVDKTDLNQAIQEAETDLLIAPENLFAQPEDLKKAVKKFQQGRNLYLYKDDEDSSENIFLTEKEFNSEDDVLESLKQGSKALEAENVWIEIGRPEKVIEADRSIRNLKKPGISEEAEVSDDATVKDSIVRPGAEIETGAVVKDSLIGENVKIAENTVVKNSTVMENSFLRSCFVEDSLILEKVGIDPFSHVESCVIDRETSIKSNTTVRESIIGEDSFVEINNSIYGVKFVPNARTDLGEISK
ncbi:MAG: hypothetical protein ABEJ83_05040 [Candidatus Nanohaloarchaea archaeon]